jgi:hypothetical protein
MQVRSEQAQQAGGGPGGTPVPVAPVSERVRLEVELLEAAADAEPATTPGGAATRHVLVCTGDPELDRYAGDCLREAAGIAVHAPRAGESALDAVGRLQASLLIAAPSVLGPASAPPPLPLLLIVEEAAQAEPWRQHPETSLAALVQPFNARRLLEAVERLLVGPADGHTSPRPEETP